MSAFTKCFCTSIIWLATSSLLCAATVVWPAAGLSSFGGYEMVYTDLSPDGGAAVLMSITESGDGAVLAAEGYTTGDGCVWYQVQPGGLIHAATLSSSEPFSDSSTGELSAFDIAYDDVFYLAFALNDPYPLDTITYGWVALLYDGTTLTMVDSAAETSGVGLYAGTYSPIPEPTTTCLSLTGLAGLAAGRRWSRRRAPRALTSS